jgi:acyl dehydratase
MPRLYLEDFTEGDRWELGEYEMSREEIVSFAERYDPQPFHVDEAAARESIFGELVASGWHTASVCIRLLTVDFLEETSHLVGKRVTDLRWLQPVRPGDRLSGHVEILGTTPSRSAPERGYLDYRLHGTTGDDETVLRMDLHGIFGCRPSATDT